MRKNCYFLSIRETERKISTLSEAPKHCDLLMGFFSFVHNKCHFNYLPTVVFLAEVKAEAGLSASELQKEHCVGFCLS